MDPGASKVLCRVTGDIGLTEKLRRALGGAGNRDEPNADADFEHLVLPGKTKLTDRAAQRTGDFLGFDERAVFKQQAKFIPTESRDEISGASVLLEQHADLLQQRVAGDVPAGVVDDLELVQVQVTQGVLAVSRADIVQEPFELTVEFRAVGEPGQGIVSGLM